MKYVALALALVACTATETRNAEDAAHTAATVACIVAHAFLPAESDVIRVCNIEPALWYLVRPTVDATKRSSLERCK